MTDTDDGVRGQSGVVVSIKEINDSTVRFVFDRVRRSGKQWKAVEFSTFRDMSKDILLKMSMSDEDLNSFGLIVTAELRALLERWKE